MYIYARKGLVMHSGIFCKSTEYVLVVLLCLFFGVQSYSREIYHPDISVQNGLPIHSTLGAGVYFAPSLTETPAFYLLVILGVVVALILLVRGLIMYFRKREEKRKDLIKLEQKYFRSQLNPHFIFNSLLAIQGFIFKKKNHEAVKYLTVFSKMMRYLFSISQEEYVPLDKELVFIRNYLDMQKLRLDDKFAYALDVEEGIDPGKILIPPMMTQPFIENAIEHGVQHKEGRGHIAVNISMIRNFLKVAISDDGIGRMKSAGVYKKQLLQHRSYGTKIMMERIELLNQLLEDNIELRIHDLHDEMKQASGTLVEILIPVKEAGS